MGTNVQSANVTIFIVHRRLGYTTGVAPLSFSTPVPADDPDSLDGALALTWQNAWQGSTTVTAGLGIASTGPGGSTWSGPAVETAPGQSGFQITTLTKANTVQVSAPWTYSADLTLRNRNLSGATESSATLTTEVVGGSPRYALGRLFQSAGAGEGFLQGDIAEVILCIGALGEADRQAVEDNLVDAYLPREQSDFRYTGHYYHGRSGLHMAPYRAYDANLGVWISEDTSGDVLDMIELAPDGANLYGYARSSPLMRLDPLGGQSIDSPSLTAVTNPGPVAKLGMDAVAEAAANAAVSQAARQAFATTCRLMAETGRSSVRYVIKNVLNKKHFNAARQEMAGKIVKLRPDGKPYDHVTEVRQAINHLKNWAKRLKRQMGDTRCEGGMRDDFQKILKEIDDAILNAQRYAPGIYP